MARLEPFGKYKILFLISAFKNCGPINVVFGIIKGLDRKQFDVSILSLSEGPQDGSIQRFKDLKVQVSHLRNSRVRGYFLNKPLVQQFIDDHKIDLIHSHGFRADLINSTIQNAKRFTTIHNFPDEDYKFRYGTVLGSLMAKKHNSVFKKIPYPICCSQHLSEKFSIVEKTSVQFVRNGIETGQYPPACNRSEKVRLREQLGLPENGYLYLVCGAISFLKNPMQVLEVFNQQPILDGLLLFLGEGELLKKLSSKNSNPNIRFLGKTNRVSDYLKAADYYISASYTEGMPNSVLEAISSEIPVVLSNITAHHEIVGENYPYLFNPKNQKDLRQKIIEVTQNGNEEIIKQLKQKVKNSFSIESMSASYQELYLKSLNRQKNKDS